MGRKGVAVQADVGSFADAQRMVADVVEKLGGLHILVTNAGMNMDAVLWKMSEEQFDRVIEVDLKGTFNYLRAAAPVFKEQGWGRFLSITSINGLRGKFGQTNYSAAKAGIIGLTKALAQELGSRNITVNAVAPGYIETDMTAKLPQEIKDAYVAKIALKRAGTPDDVAKAVRFLAGDDAAYITGHVLNLNGGMYM